MTGLRIALTFLTRLPIPVPSHSARELGQATPWFPIIGGLIGALVGLVAEWARPAVGVLSASALAVSLSLLITGALHEDGLADTFDGLGGGRNRAEALIIMKDAGVGVFGVAALVIALGLKITLLAGLPGDRLVLFSAVSAAAARAWAVTVLKLFPVVSAGLAGELSRELGTPAVVVTSLLGFGAGALLGWPQAWAIPIGWISGLLVALWARRRIGGLTGDVVGAVVVVTELGVLVAV